MKKASLFILTCGLMLSVGLEAFANPIYIDNIEFDNNLVWPESDHSTIITDDFQWPEDWVITNEELKDALLERLYATKNIELIILFSLFLGVLPIYIYFSLVYMKLAQKIGVRPAWLAWIPIANIYLISKMAQRHWWPLLLIFTFVIPFLNVVTLMIFLTFNFFWHCRIFERVGRPAWWAVTLLIPGFGSMVFLVMLSLAAWKEPAETI